MLADKRVDWFDTPVGEGYYYLPAYIDGLLQVNARRYTDYVRYAALYGNWETAQLANMFLSRGSAGWRTYKRLSFNVCSSTVDTVTNQRAAEMANIIATSSDGDYRAFVEARMVTQGVRQIFKQSKHDMAFPRVIQNACLFGNGYQTVERSGGKVRTQRIFTPEMPFDPNDNVCDQWPHTIPHVRFVNRNILKRQYPEHAAAIDQAVSDQGNSSRVRGDDNVRVDEAWTCARNGKPGKHLCCISTADLVPLEDYPYETPPFVSLPWGLPFQGWYSQGLVDQILGLQLEINDTLQIVRDAVQLFGNPFMLIENGANVNLAHVQDIPGKLLKYTNTKPEVVAPHIVQPELFQHIQICYQKAYEIAGINMYAAGAKTLPRYESSKAMRTATQEAEVRHFNFGKACERYQVELAELVCREASIAAEEDDYKTRLPRSKYFKDIPWKQIAYSVERFEIEIDTINKANDSIAGQIQDLEDLAQLQQLSVAELRRYLLNPDLKRVLHHITASDEYTDWVIYKLAYEEEYIKPDQFMDHATAFKNCVAEYLTAVRLGMSDTAQKNLLNYILALRAELKDQQQESMDMQAEAQMKAQQKVAPGMMGAPSQPQLPVTQPGSQQ